MNKLELPKNINLAAKVIESESAQNLEAMRLGRVGVWFGARDNAVLYLAWVAIVVALGIALVLGWNDSAAKSDIIHALLAFATLGLGYMFGKGH